jgi:DNA (cytosine-5)-methyltransferase 1
VDLTKELTHISLCAGYGGIDLGLSAALGATRTICFVEIEAFPQRNLVSKIEAGLLDNCPIWTDLKTMPWELFSGRVDMLSGGFPCQPFSAAGKRAGDQDPRHLFPHIVDGIKRLGRPPIVFFENVEGILTASLQSNEWSDAEGTPVLLHIHRELERMGYRTTSSLFSASEVGCAHQRKRLFILGVRADLDRQGWDNVSGMLKSTAERKGSDLDCCESGHLRIAPPAPRGIEQYAWEPSRVSRGSFIQAQTVADSGCQGLEGADTERRSIAGSSSATGGSMDRGQGQSVSREQATSNADAQLTGLLFGEDLAHTECERSGQSELSRQAEAHDAHRERSSGEHLSADSEDRCEHRSAGESATVDDSAHGGDDSVASDVSKATEGREADWLAWPSVVHGSDGSRQALAAMGGNAHGFADWLGAADLYDTLDNRTDELRLLGNGVVPATAERAMRLLFERLYESCAPRS